MCSWPINDVVDEVLGIAVAAGRVQSVRRLSSTKWLARPPVVDGPDDVA